MTSRRIARAFGWLGLLALGQACDKGDKPTDPGVTNPPKTPPACTPSCNGRTCGDDGCEGLCGSCAPGETCADGSCSEDCDRTCAELGLNCGEHCGEPCGSCAGPTDVCVSNRCTCAPQCSQATCGQADGCGGLCGPCGADQSCTDCALKLTVVEREPGFVTLALDYAANDTAPRPTVADLRLKVTGAELSRVALGASLLDADKELLADPETGKPFRTLPDHQLQLVVFSSGNTTTFAPGRLLFLRFRLDGTSGTPATFGIVSREQIFAPPSADQQLWGGHFDALVAVWPQEDAQ